MADISTGSVGDIALYLGSEAIARGALEGGVQVVASYPGNPSTEITEALRQVAKNMNIYVEWSANEKVALEAAAAASFNGLRALSGMKHNGLNVALDFVAGLSTSGLRGGLLAVVCDDPSGITSTTEQDTRPIARSLDLPLLEPATFQDAKDMAKFGLELSEKFGRLVMLRSATRLQHARGKTVLSNLSTERRNAHFDTNQQYVAFPSLPRRIVALEKLAEIKEIFENSPFNVYEGPDSPELLIICCGSCYLYAQDALTLLNLRDKVGVLKIGTVWPLPLNFIETYLRKCSRILVLEEVEPFLEGNLKALAAELADNMPVPRFFGRMNGVFKSYGELNPDLVIEAVCGILKIEYQNRSEDYDRLARATVEKLVPQRSLTLCAGCPHRASYWAIKTAIALDGRDAFVTGDIGCYSFGLFPSGYSVMKTEQAMGSGPGVGSGSGMLGQFNLKQPVIAVVGDSTFYHAALPALLNAVSNKSDLTLVVLDNGTTAMTGFQPHPGIGRNALGNTTTPVSIETICRSFGIRVEITNPYDINAATGKVREFMENEANGPRVLIMRQRCALEAKRQGQPYQVWVDEDQCIGESCGCNRYCTRIFKCPGIIRDTATGRARIDEAVCFGCGVCVNVCPVDAIKLKAIEAKKTG